MNHSNKRNSMIASIILIAALATTGCMSQGFGPVSQGATPEAQNGTSDTSNSAPPSPTTPISGPDDDLVLPTDKPILPVDSRYVRDVTIYLWTDGVVPILVNSGFTQAQKDMFMQACDDWTTGTSLKCKAFNGESSYVMVSVPYTKNDSTSSCELGVLNRVDQNLIGSPRFYGRNMIDIDPRCVEPKLVKQLIGIALGIIPENFRIVRDSYVTVHPENYAPLPSGGGLLFVPNLNRTFQVTFGDQKFASTGGYNFKAYDFASIMQANPKSYSNGSPTIQPKPEYQRYESQLGTSNALSQLDRQTIRYLYGDIVPKRTEADCLHDGMPVKAGVDIVNVYSEKLVTSGNCTPYKKQAFCTDGLNSGGKIHGTDGYPYTSCFGNNYVNPSQFKTSGRSCVFDGKTIQHLERVVAYTTKSVPFVGRCGSPITKYCYDGEWQYDYTNTLDRVGTESPPASAWIHSACTRQAPADCTFDGRTVRHGETIAAFASKGGTSCSSASRPRTCFNGQMMGHSRYVWSTCQ